MSSSSASGATQVLPQASRAWNIALWALQISTALLFLPGAVAKLAGAAPMVATFEQVGLGQWFRYFTGGLEVVFAILLLIPRTATAGAALLAATMLGAIATHLFIIGGSPAPAFLLLVITATIAWKRRPVWLA